MRVSAYNAAGRVRGVNTAYDGSYVIDGLPAGTTYKVAVEPRNHGYASVFYPNALTSATATLLTVAANSVTPNVNIGLVEGGSISGAVMSLTNTPIPGMQVRASEWTAGESVGTTVDTQRDGSYKITGLPAGNHRVRVIGPTRDPSNEYVGQYYYNSTLANFATSVVITAGEARTGIDFNLSTGGKISGVVRSAATNDPIPALGVRAYDPVTGSILAATAATTYDGSYTLTGLPVGSYYIQAQRTGSDYANMYYNGVADLALATLVTVPSIGSTTPNIDFSLLAASSSILYADLGIYGIWKYSGTGWTFLAPENPEQLVASGTYLYADLGAYGIWKHNGTSWSFLAPENPEQFAASGSNLYADLGVYGIWKYNGIGWSFLAPENPEQLVSSGMSLYADLGIYGIWKHDGVQWSKLAPEDPEELVASGAYLYADLGVYGIWKHNGTSWSKLAPENAEQLVVSGSNLYADLGVYGIWTHNGIGWSFIAPENPENMVASGSDLFADLGVYGIWKYDGSQWIKLAPENPETLAVGQ